MFVRATPRYWEALEKYRHPVTGKSTNRYIARWPRKSMLEGQIATLENQGETLRYAADLLRAGTRRGSSQQGVAACLAKLAKLDKQLATLRRVREAIWQKQPKWRYEVMIIPGREATDESLGTGRVLLPYSRGDFFALPSWADASPSLRALVSQPPRS